MILFIILLLALFLKREVRNTKDVCEMILIVKSKPIKKI